MVFYPEFWLVYIIYTAYLVQFNMFCRAYNLLSFCFCCGSMDREARLGTWVYNVQISRDNIFGPLPVSYIKHAGPGHMPQT